MNLPRSIVALLLAFLVGSPLCCCAAKGCGQALPKEARHSCCDRDPGPDPGKKAPASHACACKTKDPRDTAKAFELPGDAGVPMPVEVARRIEALEAAVTTVVVARHFFPGSDPPRARLARLSRWLL